MVHWLCGGKCHKSFGSSLPDDCPRSCSYTPILIKFEPTEFIELAESLYGRVQGQIRPVLIIAEYNFPDSLTAIRKRAWEGIKEDNKICLISFYLL